MSAYTSLIAPAELEPHLHDTGWVLFDCRHQLQDTSYGHRAYALAHIRGARFADIDADLAGPIRADTGRHPLPDINGFSAWLGTQGVTPAHQVVAYDDHHGAFAARLWWMLRFVGHDRVAVLDGGFARWAREGRPVTADPVPANPAVPYPVKPDSRMLADLDEVRAHSGRRTGMLVDARAGERYRGEHEPIDPRAGHIPGAINLSFTGNLNPDGTFLPMEQLRQRFSRLNGESPTGPAPSASIHYCGSGVTACHNILAMAAAGLPLGRLFVGSWSLWSKDPSRPAEAGPERA